MTEGRRREFRHFLAFVDPAQRETIPDPQAASTFESSVLDWDELEREPHASTFRLYRDLLKFRNSELSGCSDYRDDYQAIADDDRTVYLVRSGPRNLRYILVSRSDGPGDVDLSGLEGVDLPPGMRWQVVMTTEDPPYSPDSSPPNVSFDDEAPKIDFPGPAAVVLKAVLDH